MSRPREWPPAWSRLADACVGQLVRRGKVVAETDVVPYGMRHVAYQAAEALAAEMGVEVAS